MSNVKRCNHKDKPKLVITEKQAAAIAKLLKVHEEELFKVDLVLEEASND
jgi:hypothetical protein